MADESSSTTIKIKKTIGAEMQLMIVFALFVHINISTRRFNFIGVVIFLVVSMLNQIGKTSDGVMMCE